MTRAELYKQAVELSEEENDKLARLEADASLLSKPATYAGFMAGSNLIQDRREPLDKAVVKLIEAADSLRREYDNPVPDPIHRHNLRDWLFDSLAELDEALKAVRGGE